MAYACSYFPVERFNQVGIESVSIYEIDYFKLENINKLSANMCSYVHYCEKVIYEADIDGIVLTDCCNGMQRLYDLIRINKPELFCILLELPRDLSKKENTFFYENVEKLVQDVRNHFKLNDENEAQKPVKNGILKKEPAIDQNTVFVLGSAVSIEMKNKIENCLQNYNVVFSICGTRNNGDDLLRIISENQPVDAALKKLTPCARMTCFAKWLKLFIESHSKKLVGLIYICSQNCDSFLFSSPIIKNICDDKGVSCIVLEESYRNEGFGQMVIRLEAFEESFRRSKKTQTQFGENKTAIFENSAFIKKMKYVGGLTNQMPLKAIGKIIENQINIFCEKIWKEPEKIIWTNMVMTTELFYSFGITPVNIELLSGWLASLDMSRQLILKSESIGLSPNLCSYHKAALGLIEQGQIPKPRAAVITSNLCDGGPGIVNFFSERYGTPAYILNTPFYNNEMNFQYFYDQYNKLIDWLENFCQKKLQANQLNNSLKMANEARKYWIMAYELRKGVLPYNGYLSLRNMFGATFLMGSERGVLIAKTFYNELRNLSQVICKKKKRILWIHFAPLHNNKIMEYFENELECNIVMDITGYIYWPEHNLDKPVESLVNKALSHFYMGDPEKRNNIYKQIIEEYKIDGIIHFIHQGCRVIPGGAWQIRDLAQQYKIPYLELMGDCIDPRGFSEEQMKLRMEAFKESLGRDFSVHGN